MANKKSLANPGTVQFNKLISELPEKREKIKAQIEFRHELLESQKRVNYKNEFDRLQGAKKLPGLDANAKSRMKELQKKAIIKWSTISSYLINETLIYYNM